MTVSAQTGLNWFLLSLQTPKPSDKKNIFSFPSSRFLDRIFLCRKVRQWLPPWRTHGGGYCLTFWRRNIQTKNLDDGNMPRFVQHRRILPKLQLWLLLVDFFKYYAHMLYIPKFLYELHKYFRFPHQLFNIMKKLCKRAMT